MRLLKYVLKRFLNYDPLRYVLMKDSQDQISESGIGVLQDVFNRVIELRPRVTSHHEMVALHSLAAATGGNVLEIGSYLCYSSVIMATALGCFTAETCQIKCHIPASARSCVVPCHTVATLTSAM